MHASYEFLRQLTSGCITFENSVNNFEIAHKTLWILVWGALEMEDKSEKSDKSFHAERVSVCFSAIDLSFVQCVICTSKNKSEHYIVVLLREWFIIIVDIAIFVDPEVPR